MVEMLLDDKGQLEAQYCSSRDFSTQQPLGVLQQHLCSDFNADMSGPLLHWAKARSPAAVCLLRLTSKYAAALCLLDVSVNCTHWYLAAWC